ncbi:MAG: MSCRAMM family protein [Thermoanaerobaculia bacterium]
MHRFFASVIALCVGLTASAATLKITIDRNGFTGPIDVAIATRVDGRPPEWSSTKTLGARESNVTFRDLHEGLYTVLASGPQPLQRLSAKANVGANDLALTLSIPKSRAVLRTMLAGAPIPAAHIALTHEELRWSTQVETGVDGFFAGDLWEPALYIASVSRDRTSAPHRIDLYIDSKPKTIDVPDRHIRGHVVDADGAPIADALITLRSEGGESTLSMRTRSSSDGRFEFFGVREGAHTIAARATSFLDSDAARFELRGNQTHTVDLELTHGDPRTVRVLDKRDRPLSNATLITSCNGDVKSTAMTNEEGIAEVAQPRSGSCAIYALPIDGSIGVGGFNGNESIVIRVPEGTSSLNLVLKSEAGDAFSNLKLLMRIDGTVVPPEIARLLSTRGFPLTTNDEGSVSLRRIPPGTYEFWPYRSNAEGQMLYEIASEFAAPISVNVLTGENNATIKFAAR